MQNEKTVQTSTFTEQVGDGHRAMTAQTGVFFALAGLGDRDIMPGVKEKRLPPDAFSKLCQFVGYGNPDANVWFIGLEERLDQETPAEILEQLHVRLKFEPVEDLQHALELLDIFKYHRDKPILQPTWTRMCCIMLGLDGKVDNKPDDRRCYQKNRLGRSQCETLLAELFQLPKPAAGKWPDVYRKEFDFTTVGEYRESEPVLNRIELLQKRITSGKPNIVICYGKSAWGYFKKLFKDVDFNEDNRNEIETGEFVRTGTFVILTHHFSRMSFCRAKRIVEIIAKRKNPKSNHNYERLTRN